MADLDLYSEILEEERIPGTGTSLDAATNWTDILHLLHSRCAGLETEIQILTAHLDRSESERFNLISTNDRLMDNFARLGLACRREMWKLKKRIQSICAKNKIPEPKFAPHGLAKPSIQIPRMLDPRSPLLYDDIVNYLYLCHGPDGVGPPVASSTTPSSAPIHHRLESNQSAIVKSQLENNQRSRSQFINEMPHAPERTQTISSRSTRDNQSSRSRSSSSSTSSGSTTSTSSSTSASTQTVANCQLESRPVPRVNHHNETRDNQSGFRSEAGRSTGKTIGRSCGNGGGSAGNASRRSPLAPSYPRRVPLNGHIRREFLHPQRERASASGAVYRRVRRPNRDDVRGSGAPLRSIVRPVDTPHHRHSSHSPDETSSKKPRLNVSKQNRPEISSSAKSSTQTPATDYNRLTAPNRVSGDDSESHKKDVGTGWGSSLEDQVKSNLLKIVEGSIRQSRDHHAVRRMRECTLREETQQLHPQHPALIATNSDEIPTTEQQEDPKESTQQPIQNACTLYTKRQRSKLNPDQPTTPQTTPVGMETTTLDNTAESRSPEPKTPCRTEDEQSQALETNPKNVQRLDEHAVIECLAPELMLDSTYANDTLFNGDDTVELIAEPDRLSPAPSITDPHSSCEVHSTSPPRQNSQSILWGIEDGNKEEGEIGEEPEDDEQDEIQNDGVRSQRVTRPRVSKERKRRESLGLCDAALSNIKKSRDSETDRDRLQKRNSGSHSSTSPLMGQRYTGLKKRSSDERGSAVPRSPISSRIDRVARPLHRSPGSWRRYRSPSPVELRRRTDAPGWTPPAQTSRNTAFPDRGYHPRVIARGHSPPPTVAASADPNRFRGRSWSTEHADHPRPSRVRPRSPVDYGPSKSTHRRSVNRPNSTEKSRVDHVHRGRLNRPISSSNSIPRRSLFNPHRSMPASANSRIVQHPRRRF